MIGDLWGKFVASIPEWVKENPILNAIFTGIIFIAIPFVFTVGVPFWIIFIACLAVKDFYDWVMDHFRPESDFEYVEEYEN